MLENITYKTNIEEIISLEEVNNLFDEFAKNNSIELIALSLFPILTGLRKKIIINTKVQRNSELSKLLQTIEDRKVEIKNSIKNVKQKKENNDTDTDLEQMIYEEEQIIAVYENNLKKLEQKEKSIIKGNYIKLLNSKNTISKKTLRKNAETLKSKLIEISKKHDNCYKEIENDLTELIDKTIITKNNIVPKANIVIEKIVINKNAKDFYNYEPNMLNIDDTLIYELLIQGDYLQDDGTINGLMIDSAKNIIIE